MHRRSTETTSDHGGRRRHGIGVNVEHLKEGRRGEVGKGGGIREEKDVPGPRTGEYGALSHYLRHPRDCPLDDHDPLDLLQNPDRTRRRRVVELHGIFVLRCLRGRGGVGVDGAGCLRAGGGGGRRVQARDSIRRRRRCRQDLRLRGYVQRYTRESPRFSERSTLSSHAALDVPPVLCLPVGESGVGTAQWEDEGTRSGGTARAGGKCRRGKEEGREEKDVPGLRTGEYGVPPPNCARARLSTRPRPALRSPDNMGTRPSSSAASLSSVAWPLDMGRGEVEERRGASLFAADVVIAMCAAVDGTWARRVGTVIPIRRGSEHFRNARFALCGGREQLLGRHRLRLQVDWALPLSEWMALHCGELAGTVACTRGAGMQRDVRRLDGDDKWGKTERQRRVQGGGGDAKVEVVLDTRRPQHLAEREGDGRTRGEGALIARNKRQRVERNRGMDGREKSYLSPTRAPPTSPRSALRPVDRAGARRAQMREEERWRNKSDPETKWARARVVPWETPARDATRHGS
ncbi:hypothetical protein C8R45DRAFT_1124956 [Mycena sanguinolenta]|nr:hypothetical protein C8R45DRAFT_1124956 [Mycena sanguinolenta]